MNNVQVSLICFLVFFSYCHNVEGIDVDLSEKDMQEAIDLGEQQKSNITKHLEKQYIFRRFIYVKPSFEIISIIQ